MKRLISALAFLIYCCSILVPVHAEIKTISFTAEIWADNWFAIYVNGKKVGEDSVPFATEKSFNSEIVSFKATYPLTIGIVARDYYENESGLEYIGKANQQIGDGGLIAQIRETNSGSIVGFTNKAWRAFVVQRAPLNVECVKSKDPLQECKRFSAKTPISWYSKTFKDSTWKVASEYSASEVGVKQGYLNINWSSDSKLIWASDLRLDNTVLLRGKILQPKTDVAINPEFLIGSPDFVSGGLLPIDQTCDGKGISPALNFSGVPSNVKSLAIVMDTIPGPLRPGEADVGNHVYFLAFNIPPNTVNFPAGATGIGVLGQNFQGKKLGYTPPCSQGKGIKEYTITAFALSDSLTLDAINANQSAFFKAIEGKVIAKSALMAKYQRP